MRISKVIEILKDHLDEYPDKECYIHLLRGDDTCTIDIEKDDNEAFLVVSNY